MDYPLHVPGVAADPLSVKPRFSDNWHSLPVPQLARARSRPRASQTPWASVNDIAQISVEGARIVLCHYAMRVWPGDRRGAVMLYGHSHGRLSGNSQSLDVGVDCWGFAPASWSQVRERLATLPPRLPLEDDDALAQGV